MISCRFAAAGCKDEAVARYSVPQGCACWPCDTVQDLCLHHASEAEPLGEMKIIKVYSEELVKLLDR
jgi:hypothetical protein